MVAWILDLESAIKYQHARHAGMDVYIFSFCFLSLLDRKKLSDCAGHFGYIQLELPVFHAGYFRHTLTILQCICKSCSRVLLGPEDRASFLKKVKSPSLDALLRAAIFKRVTELCKRSSTCPYCGFANG